jgi:hypothetical protein
MTDKRQFEDGFMSAGPARANPAGRIASKRRMNFIGCAALGGSGDLARRARRLLVFLVPRGGNPGGGRTGGSAAQGLR